MYALKSGWVYEWNIYIYIYIYSYLNMDSFWTSGNIYYVFMWNAHMWVCTVMYDKYISTLFFIWNCSLK
jgi:hypothetical protein